MAAATLMEQELQNSVAFSEEDAEYEDDDMDQMMASNADAFAANRQLQNGLLAAHGEEEDEEVNGDGDDGDVEGDSEDAEDAEGELDDDAEAEDENEGVGAVKIQPGLDDDDDDESLEEADDGDDEDIESKAGTESTDAEGEVDWEALPDEEDDIVNLNSCIFCHQQEENDPSEEFELYLACCVCGDNAHRQCARDANSLRDEEEAESWGCPGCVLNNLHPDDESAGVKGMLEISEKRISIDKVPGDLLPSQRGGIKPDSHSVFNQLIAPDDPLDGSRLLRKRKTSTDADAEEGNIFKRRHRDRGDGTGNLSGEFSDDRKETNDMISSTFVDAGLNDNNLDHDLIVSSRPSRSLRLKISTRRPKVRKIKSIRGQTCVIAIPMEPQTLQQLVSAPQKKKKKSINTSSAPSSAVLAPNFVPSNFSQPFYSLHDRDIDEFKSKPYGGILSEADADTTLTLPQKEHRRQFDEARQKAEEDRELRLAKAAEAAVVTGQKKSRKVSGPASQIEYIEFGIHQIDIWYAAPYPEEYSRNKALFICEFCLKYMESDIVAWRHKTKCPWKHPPGDEIYRDGKIMIFEVDGRKNPLYCQNLCLLAKLFLGSKTLYYDVEPFLFYVMTEYDINGCHFVGYFSKEKRPSSLNNVSCILVLPIHQRKGYGHLLMDFSYLLTRVERKTGSPEKPLSDMGLVSYRNYWRYVLCYYLRGFSSGDMIPNVRNISNQTGLTPDDVISALDGLGALIRDPVTGTYALKLKTDIYQEVIRQHEAKGYAKLNPKALIWTPYIMGRGNASTFDQAPPLNTVAQRDEVEGDISPAQTQPFDKRNLETFRKSNDKLDVLANSLSKSSTNNGEPSHINTNERLEGSKSSGIDPRLAYYEAAAFVPPTRFEVFPPTPGPKNRNNARASSRPARSRPSVSSASRSSPKRSQIKRTSRESRPRSKISRRRNGETGRASKRRPKGPKKFDFGLTDSGLSLPPKLKSRKSRLGNAVSLKNGDESDFDNEKVDDERSPNINQEVDEVDEDAIEYDTPAPKSRRGRDLAQGRALGFAKSLLGEIGLGTMIGAKGTVVEPLDIEMLDATGDIDAEGEDE